MIKRSSKTSMSSNMYKPNYRRAVLRQVTDYRDSEYKSRLEKNIISDDCTEAESEKEFYILAKTMCAHEEDIGFKFDAKQYPFKYEVIIGRLKEDPKSVGGKAVVTIVVNNPKDGKKEYICATSGKLAGPVLERLLANALVCAEIKEGAREYIMTRLVYMSGGGHKTESVHKVSSLCKASYNEDAEEETYKVSCITREHSSTRKKYSGEFESLKDAMKVCAQAYNAGVDVMVERGNKPFAKIYTKTKEFEDFTEDGSAGKAFRDAMLWAASPTRKKNAESIEEMEPVRPLNIDTSVDADVLSAAQDAENTHFDEAQENDSGIKGYAKNHQVVVLCESRVNGFRLSRMACGNPKPIK